MKQVWHARRWICAALERSAPLRSALGAAAFVAVAVAPGAGARQAAGPVAGAAVARGAAQVRVTSTLSGALVTNARGFVLFTFPKERHGIALCMRTPSCMSDWPPVLTTGTPVAGPGLKAALLGTIPYKGTLRVVTYAGWPLHTYRFAYSAQASVIDIGITQFGGRWVALNAAGRFVG